MQNKMTATSESQRLGFTATYANSLTKLLHHQMINLKSKVFEM